MVFGNVAVRRIDAATGLLSTVVGTNMFGWTGDDYPAAGNPSFPVISLAVSPPRPGAPDGELHFGVQGYVTAGGSSAALQFDLVRKVDGGGLLETVVGREEAHETIGTSDVARPAIRVLLREASSLAFDGDELYYAEKPANVVYRVVGADDTIVAKPGTMAKLTQVEVWPGTSYMLLVHPGLRRDWFDERPAVQDDVARPGGDRVGVHVLTGRTEGCSGSATTRAGRRRSSTTRPGD